MRKNQFRAFAGIATLSLCLGLGAAVMPANVKAADVASTWNWEQIKSDKTFVSLTPGVDETELNFAWYSQKEDDAQVRFGTSQNLTDDDLVQGSSENASTTVENTKINDGYYSNKVTVTGLKENTTYYYQVKKNGKWQEPEKYQTRSFSDFSFLYVGDPQIGASTSDSTNDGACHVANQEDATNWEKVLNQATENFDLSFMISAGDQINESDASTVRNWNMNEEQYSGYLGATALRSLPVATTIGNHDHGFTNYSAHFNNPNNQDEASSEYNSGESAAGTDYYYTYGNVLFIVLDTNNYNCATHENVMKKAIKENPDAKWRVVTFHHDIYGSATSHSDSDGMVLRTQLTPLMDKYDIDVVLQGHDHSYSRTYQLSGDGENHVKYGDSSIEGVQKPNYNDRTFQRENANCYELKSDVVGGTVVNPEGTVYYEANSASGSKYYDLVSTQQNYIAERSQSHTPTYSVVTVTDDTFSVTTYDAGEKINNGNQLANSTTYTIKKTDAQEETPSTDDKQNNITNITNNNYNITVNKGEDKDSQTAQTSTAASSLKKVKGVKVTKKAGNKVSVKWNTVKGADGYQIQYTYKKGFKKAVKTVNVNKASKSSKVLKKMKTGKKVYVKVRAFQNVNGQKVYGNFSKVKKLTVR